MQDVPVFGSSTFPTGRFGAFSVKQRPERTGRNPRTGAHVSVDQKYVPFFKTGKEMRERLNRDGAA